MADNPIIQVPKDPIIQVPKDPDQVSEGQFYKGTDTVKETYKAGGGNSSAITVWRYPETLGRDPQYPHYLMFYVNARDGSAAATTRSGRTDSIENQKGQLRIDPAHSVAAAGFQGAVSGAVTAAKGTYKTLSSQIDDKSSYFSQVKSIGISGAAAAIAGVLGAGAGGAAVGSVYADLNNRPLIKIKDVIALHVNNPPSVAYKANWSEVDMSYIGAVGANGIGEAGEVAGLADIALRSAAGNMAKVAGGPNNRDVLEATSRKVVNPYKEQLFKSMGMRQFSYDYTFMPRNAREARNALNIIRIFKRNMHPEMDKSKLFLIYPSEFNIVYYFKDGENPYINKISSCVLTDMQVKFGDERDFTTFAGGFPTMINLRLQFLELEMLTGERVDSNVALDNTIMGF